DLFPQRLGGELRGMLTRLGATHPIGHHVEADRGSNQVIILVIGTDAPRVGRAKGFEHSPTDYTGFEPPVIAIAIEIFAGGSSRSLRAALILALTVGPPRGNLYATVTRGGFAS